LHGVGADIPPRQIWKGAVAHLKAVDPVMKKIIEKHGSKSPKISIVDDPFEALVRAILHQNVRAEQSSVRVERLKAMFNRTFPRPSQILTTRVSRLKEIGVTENQVRAIYELARGVARRKIDLGSLTQLGDAEVVDELQKLRGVGEWSAHMFLVFHMRRPDVWMPGDTSLRNAVEKVFKLDHAPTRKEMDDIAEKWRPYRSAAAWYIWSEGGGFTPGLH
jgi:DNA-3-methyladenine glycosylase II